MKTQIKQQRADILKEIDRLELERCAICFGNARTPVCECPAAVEIRELGEQMNRLVRERKEAPGYSRQNYDPKMVALAEQNGIDYDRFWARVKLSGWTEYRAATEPIKRKGVRK